MIDDTKTLSCVKSELCSYDSYGFASDETFSTRITEIADQVKVEKMDYYLSEYDGLKAIGYAGLEGTQLNIFWAEVYLICSYFLNWYQKKNEQMREADSESINVDGYARSLSGKHRAGGVSVSYFQKAILNLSIAGYDVLKIGRNR